MEIDKIDDEKVKEFLSTFLKYFSKFDKETRYDLISKLTESDSEYGFAVWLDTHLDKIPIEIRTELESKLDKIGTLDNIVNQLKIYFNKDKIFQNKLQSIFLEKEGINNANLGRLEDAIHCFDRVLKIEPTNVGALYNKSLTLLKLKKYEESLTLCDKALEIEPDRIDVWINKGTIFANLGRLEDAIHCFDRVLKIEPTNVGALYNKGTIFAKLGKYDEELATYSHALELEPANISILVNTGNSHINLGNYEKALNYYEKALSIDPNNELISKARTIALKLTAPQEKRK